MGGPEGPSTRGGTADWGGGRAGSCGGAALGGGPTSSTESNLGGSGGARTGIMGAHSELTGAGAASAISSYTCSGGVATGSGGKNTGAGAASGWASAIGAETGAAALGAGGTVGLKFTLITPAWKV